MTSERPNYVQAALAPDQVERAAFDIAADTEAGLRRRLGDEPTLLASWSAVLFDRDERGIRVRVEWIPGTPVPPRTHLLRCTVWAG
jgi:hypothetical protein